MGIVAHIQKKLKDKFYHPETWLLCYIRRPGETIRLIDIIQCLYAPKTAVREIWILFNLEGTPFADFHIARVYLRNSPQKEVAASFSGNYIELSKKYQSDFLKDTRASGKTVKITHGETVIVPLPSLH